MEVAAKQKTFRQVTYIAWSKERFSRPEVGLPQILETMYLSSGPDVLKKEMDITYTRGSVAEESISDYLDLMNRSPLFEITLTSTSEHGFTRGDIVDLGLEMEKRGYALLGRSNYEDVYMSPEVTLNK